MKEYQPNSHLSKERAATENLPEKKVEKVVSGKVKTRENKGRKIADVFISEDAANVKSYILMDVLVPAFKKLVSDIVTDGIAMLLYGSTGSGAKNRSTGKVSYRSYYEDKEDRRDRTNYAGRNRFNYDDIIFETRVEAETVREQMFDIIKRYGFVTVSDLYDLAGLEIPFTGNKYGWADIRNSEVVRTRDGYELKLSRPMPID